MNISADIFLSYNREDAARAKHFADAFAAAGFTVWWDVELRSGEAYDEVTERALREAKAVVVLWSPRSVVSRWVRAEATLADRNKTLMPVMMEMCERPIMFELVQTADLVHWQGDANDVAWRDFVSHVRDRVGKSPASVAATNAATPKRQLPSKPSIAVLPFINLSGDVDQEYFADGVVDDIISALSRFNQLFVIARSSSFTYKGRKVDYRTVADELGVRFVLEGSIRKAGNRLRISGQLVDAQSGAHLWAERYEGALEAVFELQDRITEQVVGAIEPSIQRAEILRSSSKTTESLDAYDLFLQALPLLWSFKQEGNAPARSLLEQALALDPDYPQALAAMAWAYEQARWMGLKAPPGEFRSKATNYARRGLATGSDDSYVLAQCAFVLLIAGHDVPAAHSAKDRALLRNPNMAWVAHSCSLIEAWTGDPQKALELAERAFRLTPQDPNQYFFFNTLGTSLMALSRWAEAVPVVDRLLNDRPDFMPALSLGAAIYGHAGELDKARECGRRLRMIDPGMTGTGYLNELPPLTPSMEASYRRGFGWAGLSVMPE